MKFIVAILFLAGLCIINVHGYAQSAGTKKSYGAKNNCPRGADDPVIGEQDAGHRKKHLKGSQAYIKIHPQAWGGQPDSTGPFTLRELYEIVLDQPNPVTGLKVYFGLLKNDVMSTTDANYTKGHENQLVAIFVATKADAGKNRVDVGPYFIFSPGDHSRKAIDKETAQDWYSAYRNLVQPIVNETATLWFPVNALLDLRTNLTCQYGQDSRIDHFNLCWAAYDKDIVLKDKTKKNVTGHLTFVLSVPYADPIPQEKSASYDTAIPCPPGTDCNDGDGLEDPQPLMKLRLNPKKKGTLK